MLEIRRVVHAWSQQHHDRIVRTVGRHGAQRFEQQIRIVRDGRHLVLDEQLGKEPHHHLAVFEHVGHAGGHAQIIFEHIKSAVASVTHDVDARNMRIDAQRQIDALHLRPVLRVRVDLLRRNHAGAHDIALVIDVVKEEIERLHALAQPSLEQGPFVCRNDARYEVEGNEPLGAGEVTIHRERDADPPEQQVRLGTLARHRFAGLPLQPVLETFVVRAHRALIAHLVMDLHRFVLARVSAATFRVSSHDSDDMPCALR
jgi:hypothetical protein